MNDVLDRKQNNICINLKKYFVLMAQRWLPIKSSRFKPQWEHFPPKALIQDLGVKFSAKIPWLDSWGGGGGGYFITEHFYIVFRRRLSLVYKEVPQICWWLSRAENRCTVWIGLIQKYLEICKMRVMSLWLKISLRWGVISLFTDLVIYLFIKIIYCWRGF